MLKSAIATPNAQDEQKDEKSPKYMHEINNNTGEKKPTNGEREYSESKNNDRIVMPSVIFCRHDIKTKPMTIFQTVDYRARDIRASAVRYIWSEFS